MNQTPLDPHSPEHPIPQSSSVSQLLTECDRLLKTCFPQVTVQGEVSNLLQARSGHWYFSLKDAQGSIRCACFKQHAMRMPITLSEGMAITVTAQVAIYQARGDFQLIVSNIRLFGDGELKKRFEALKNQLAQSGLFDPSRKKPLPTLPCTIGIITSPTGAAVRDIITTLQRRAPHVQLVIYPCLVQGDQAKHSICMAFDLAEAHATADMLILARGGGSLEDLWPFNEEIVANRLAACPIPLITGVGHEVDTTIVDLIADQRAPTPTAAAEMASPDIASLMQTITSSMQRLSHAHQHLLQTKKQTLKNTLFQLKHPKHTIAQHMQTLDFLQVRLHHAAHRHINKKRLAMTQPLAALDALNPSKLLQSGFTMTMHNGKVISSAKSLHSGDSITLQFHDGTVEGRVV